MRERIREIIMQTCNEMGVHIVKGVLARDHVHMPEVLHLSSGTSGTFNASARRVFAEPGRKGFC